nr:hypothetical protein OG999_04785 [Streptomyces sp. NBC_00886]
MPVAGAVPGIDFGLLECALDVVTGTGTGTGELPTFHPNGTRVRPTPAWPVSASAP